MGEGWEGRLRGHAGEATIHNPFRYLGKGQEENDDAEGAGAVVGQFSWFVYEDAVGFPQKGGVEAIGPKGGQ